MFRGKGEEWGIGKWERTGREITKGSVQDGQLAGLHSLIGAEEMGEIEGGFSGSKRKTKQYSSKPGRWVHGPAAGMEMGKFGLDRD